MQSLRAIHLTHSISRLGGGLFESVRRLSQSLQAAGQIEVKVVAPADSRSAEDATLWAPVTTRACRVFGPKAFGYAPGIVPHLVRNPADLLHLHGLWKYPAVAVNRWFRQTGRPYVISPHGMLEPWALRQSRGRKCLAGWLYQEACLRRAACLRATSRMEYDNIRRAGYSNPVAVIPNGVELPKELPRRPTSRAGERWRALFLSRIHPKKGLLDLVHAWNRLRPPGWELVVVGPDEAGHLAEVRAAAGAAGPAGSIVFAGEAWGEARLRFYADSELFVLHSYSENFGLVIAEALSCGVPVLTTQATPWQELREHRCGWWIETGTEPLAAALREALALPPETLREMGRRGRRLIEPKYTWAPIGRQLLEVYQWMLGRRARPECVLG